MSQVNYITELLDLKDKNISISDTITTKTVKDISNSIKQKIALDLTKKICEVYQLLLSDVKRKDYELLFKHIERYINDVAFGYRSFLHFRNRILITRKLVTKKEIHSSQKSA